MQAELVYSTNRTTPLIIQRIEAQRGNFVIEIPSHNVRPGTLARIEKMRQVHQILEKDGILHIIGCGV